MKNEAKKDLLKGKENDVAKAMQLKDEDVLKAINEGNISKALSTFKTLKKEGKGKTSLLYKDAIYDALNDKQKKSLRQKVRKKRNTFAKDIISLKGAKDKKERILLIKEFIKFYKMIYKLNDFTFASLSASNNDEDTYILINDMLNIIKKDKVKV